MEPLANTVKLATDGTTVAVVWPLFRSELALISPSGEVKLHPLPYFGQAWAPLAAAGGCGGCPFKRVPGRRIPPPAGVAARWWRCPGRGRL